MAHNTSMSTATPEEIGAEMGRRFEKIRLGRNINQTQLAQEAGVSRRTITRLENGGNVSLDTVIRVLRALGLVDRLTDLLPDPGVRPIERVRFKGRERQRARPKDPSPGAEWNWDDEPDRS